MENIAIGKEFKAIMNFLKRLSHADAKARGLDAPEDCSKRGCKATAMHGMFIGYIFEKTKEGKDVYQKDLEREFSLRRSTATEILKLMEKNGFIEKKNVPNDARLKKLVLTEKALSEHANAVEGIKLMEQKITKGLSQEELDVLYKILCKIKNNLSE